MRKVEIPELGAECQLISGYEDLRKKDLVRLVRMAYLMPSNVSVKIELLRKLFVAPPIVWEHLESPENHDQVWRLLQTLEWVWKGPEYRPLSFLRIRGKEYMLPDQQLYQVGTAEFVIATAHLIGFYTAKDDACAMISLAKFTSTIARPKPDVLHRLRKGNEADPREEFNSIRCDRRALMFTKVDLVAQIMIAQWFNNAANKLLDQYGMKGGDPAAAPISQGIFVQDWERQVVRVAESQVYGNYDKVMERPLTDILAYIELKNDEIRRQIEAKKGK